MQKSRPKIWMYLMNKNRLFASKMSDMSSSFFERKISAHSAKCCQDCVNCHHESHPSNILVSEINSVKNKYVV